MTITSVINTKMTANTSARERAMDAASRHEDAGRSSVCLNLLWVLGLLLGLIHSAQAANVALATAGAVVTASSTLAGHPASALIDNERSGVTYNTGHEWVDGTPGVNPDWLQINFAAAKTIDKVVVYTLQDNYISPVEPSDTMTFASYGVTNFTVQGWDGTNWVTLGTVTGNNLVKRTVTFAAYTTDRIRVNINLSVTNYNYLTEIEAWESITAPGAPTNVVATAGVAQATVTFLAPVINGGTPITRYTATSSPGGLTGNCNAPCTSLIVAGLTNGTAYTFTVQAANAVGTSVASAPSNSVTPGVVWWQTYYIHTDHLDTPRMITDTAGNVVWTWDNTDPFGNNVPNENPNNAGTFSFNLRFPGQYFDKETNTNYNINRDYDPAIGRYIESDPIGLSGGINTYTYVLNNPLRWVDPKGLANGPAISAMHPPIPSPTVSGGIGGCLFTACVTYDSKDTDSKISIPFPPDVGGQVSIIVSPPQKPNMCTANDPPKTSKSLNFGIGHFGFSLNNDGGFSLNLGIGIASPIEVQIESPPSR